MRRSRQGERKRRSDRDLTVSVAKATAAALAVAAVAVGLWKVSHIVVLLLLAVTCAAAIRPGVEWLCRHRVPEAFAILLSRVPELCPRRLRH